MGYMYPIQTIPLNLNFWQNQSTYMESSHNAPTIHAFNLAQKIFLYTVNSQKPRAECTQFRHVPHSDKCVFALKYSKT